MEEMSEENAIDILETFKLANIPEIIDQEEFDDVKKAITVLIEKNKKIKKQSSSEAIAHIKLTNHLDKIINALILDMQKSGLNMTEQEIYRYYEKKVLANGKKIIEEFKKYEI